MPEVNDIDENVVGIAATATAASRRNAATTQRMSERLCMEIFLAAAAVYAAEF